MNTMLRIATTLLLVTLALPGCGVEDPTAAAGGETTGEESEALSSREICAQDVYVRQSPQGIISGRLYCSEHFTVSRYSPSGGWAYGFAHGNVNHAGWIENGHFCGQQERHQPCRSGP